MYQEYEHHQELGRRSFPSPGDMFTKHLRLSAHVESRSKMHAPMMYGPAGLCLEMHNDFSPKHFLRIKRRVARCNALPSLFIYYKNVNILSSNSQALSILADLCWFLSQERFSDSDLPLIRKANESLSFLQKKTSSSFGSHLNFLMSAISTEYISAASKHCDSRLTKLVDALCSHRSVKVAPFQPIIRCHEDVADCSTTTVRAAYGEYPFDASVPDELYEFIIDLSTRFFGAQAIILPSRFYQYVHCSNLESPATLQELMPFPVLSFVFCLDRLTIEQKDLCPEPGDKRASSSSGFTHLPSADIAFINYSVVSHRGLESISVSHGQSIPISSNPRENILYQIHTCHAGVNNMATGIPSADLIHELFSA